METRPKRRPSAELRLAVLCSIDHAPGNNITQRIRAVSYRQHIDPITGQAHQFTWRTIQSWYSRHKKDGITVIENKTRKDRFTTRKISVAQLAEAIKETLGDINPNKVGRSLKSALYKTMIKKGLITRVQIAPTTFYRFIREHDLLKDESIEKERLSSEESRAPVDIHASQRVPSSSEILASIVRLTARHRVCRTCMRSRFSHNVILWRKSARNKIRSTPARPDESGRGRAPCSGARPRVLCRPPRSSGAW